MIKNFKTLADRLKGVQVNGKDITAEDLKSFLTSEEEVEVTSSKVTLLTDAEIDEMKTTVGGGAKNQGYVDGMKAGAEQLVKAIRNSKGLEFEGKLKYGDEGKIDFDATASHVAEHFEHKILSDAKIEPEKRINELEKTLKKVQDTYESEKSTWEKTSKEFEFEKKKLKQDYHLETTMPDVEILNKKQLVTLFKNDGYGVDFDEDGIPYPVRHGKRVVDKVEKPIPLEAVYADFIERNSWNKKPAGKGDGDRKPDPSPEFKTKNEVFAYLEANKIDLQSEKAQNMLNKVEKQA